MFEPRKEFAVKKLKNFIDNKLVEYSKLRSLDFGLHLTHISVHRAVKIHGLSSCYIFLQAIGSNWTGNGTCSARPESNKLSLSIGQTPESGVILERF